MALTPLTEDERAALRPVGFPGKSEVPEPVFTELARRGWGRWEEAEDAEGVWIVWIVSAEGKRAYWTDTLTRQLRAVPVAVASPAPAPA